MRAPEIRAAQAELASAHGIEAFCYWHYWFAGRRLLERPFTEVLRSKQPSLKFCLAWANQSWTGVWHGRSDDVLVRQTYPGLTDHEAHFSSLMEAFTDERYLLVDGKPLLVIFRPHEIPDTRRFLDCWRELAHTAGLKGLHLVGQAWRDECRPTELGFDASFCMQISTLRRWARRFQPRARIPKLRQSRFGRPGVCSYEKVQPLIRREFIDGDDQHPCLLPNWDNTPRTGAEGLVLSDPTPGLFAEQVRQAVERVAAYDPSRRLVFVKSWNEWAEGNYLEPELRFGRGYLQAIRDARSVLQQ